MRQLLLIMLALATTGQGFAQTTGIDAADVVWHSPSKNAAASMPAGGGDVGLNVWVENGDILFYLAKSGCFDENNASLKLGRVRLQLSPNPFIEGTFSQRLHLEDGSIYITGEQKSLTVKLHIWVDVHAPVVHLDMEASRPVKARLAYESWRYKDHILRGRENEENSYRFAPQGTVKTYRDSIAFLQGGVVFYHRNRDTTLFDVTVHEQQLDSVRYLLYNPLKHRTFGGRLEADGLHPAGTGQGIYLNTPYHSWQLTSTHPVKSLHARIYLATALTPTPGTWRSKLDSLASHHRHHAREAWQQTRSWWEAFWQRSFIYVTNSPGDAGLHREMALNYQRFRYLLACNAYGAWPTKFNGGLFTFDPVLVNPKDTFTPDYRRWGGGTFTAQNQRLLYYPMIKAGDWDMLRGALEFYRRLLPTAEIRSRVYWGHDGAAFTEQLENFGLPNASEYGWKRPAGFDAGMQYNAWLEYLWDTALEFCGMALEAHSYGGLSVRPYLPLIESCLTFFDQHYRYLASRRGRKSLDGKGHLILFPGSAAETYKMTLNASSTIAALTTVLKGLLRLPDSLVSPEKRAYFTTLQKRIPPLPLGMINGHPVIRPAESWERIQNVESPQLYPVFPWHIYGLGKPGLEIARNTWRYDTDVVKHRGYIGWKQDNIFAALLGFTPAADSLTALKLRDGPFRYPAFWGPGFDWAPDHNWGGTAMTGLQDMLLQTAGDSILLFPAWPRKVDVHFRLHAPGKTVVEATLLNGALSQLKVTPATRRKNVRVMLGSAH